MIDPMELQFAVALAVKSQGVEVEKDGVVGTELTYSHDDFQSLHGLVLESSVDWSNRITVYRLVPFDPDKHGDDNPTVQEDEVSEDADQEAVTTPDDNGTSN